MSMKDHIDLSGKVFRCKGLFDWGNDSSEYGAVIYDEDNCLIVVQCLPIINDLGVDRSDLLKSDDNPNSVWIKLENSHVFLEDFGDNNSFAIGDKRENVSDDVFSKCNCSFIENEYLDDRDLNSIRDLFDRGRGSTQLLYHSKSKSVRELPIINGYDTSNKVQLSERGQQVDMLLGIDFDSNENLEDISYDC